MTPRNKPESIEWPIEDQAFPPSYDLAPPPPTPPTPSASCVSFSVFLCFASRVHLREKGLGGAKFYDGERPGPLLIFQYFSAINCSGSNETLSSCNKRSNSSNWNSISKSRKIFSELRITMQSRKNPRDKSRCYISLRSILNQVKVVIKPKWAC